MGYKKQCWPIFPTTCNMGRSDSAMWMLSFLKEVEQHQDCAHRDTDLATKRKVLGRVQKMLIAAQEVGDEKLQVVQQIQDLIENRTRQLDLDYGNLEDKASDRAAPPRGPVMLTDLGKDQENTEPNRENHHSVITPAVGGGGIPSASTPSERQTKRPRRTRNDTATGLDTNNQETPIIEPRGQLRPLRLSEGRVPRPRGEYGEVDQEERGGSDPLRRSKRPRTSRNDLVTDLASPEHNGANTSSAAISTPINTSSSGAQKKGSTGGKKKKRKSRQSQQQQQQQQIQQLRDDTPPPGDELAIDPNEPTYCLCDQISYGEMILCDNDLCPIEWFHFSCVALTTKPKGKWFCPRCRGDRSNVMKPKQQFLKELERYNKEKEEKS
uniref:Inhibitor of growth protein n=1 Tax=Timema californicum TaxID=61474 RepID=A0A7R9JC88_TIMCA|nr:unnamed protein product [Timema californicum]